MRNKSVISEARDIRLAVELIQLGARLQMLEAETNLSRERLLKLYKEVRGVSPPKGMLPFSTDWFMTWQPNVHASLFMAYFRFLERNTKLIENGDISRSNFDQAQTAYNSAQARYQAAIDAVNQQLALVEQQRAARIWRSVASW